MIMEQGARKRPLSTMCREVARSANAGHLLYRILFWYDRARVQHHDGRWIANTREWWIGDTGLTPKQYRDAITALKKRGLIKVTYRRFKGLRMTHIQPIVTVEEIMAKGHTVRVGPNGHPVTPGPNGHAVYVHGEPTRKNLQKISAHGAEFKEPEMAKDGSGKGMDITKGKLGGSVNDIKKVMANHSPGKKAKKGTVSEAFEVWRDAVVETYPGTFVVAWTGKQRGMVGALMKKVPPDKVIAVLDNAVRNWIDLIVYLEENTSAFKLPVRPDLGIVVRFAQGVLDFDMGIPKKLTSSEGEAKQPNKMKTLGDVLAKKKEKGP